MDYSTENVEKAVHQFYHDAANQQEINKWLTTAQVSPQAWTFCWELLAKEKSIEVQFYGASSVHVKISRYWHELPPAQVEHLRSKLLEQIVSYAAGPKMVLTRLCVALASFVNQSTPDKWPDAVGTIIQTFQESNLPHLSGSHVCMVLLEILTVLPEEFNTAHLSAQRKGVVRHELTQSLQKVLPLIQSLLNPATPPVIYDQTLKCFSSWIQFGVPLQESTSIILQVFQAVQNESLFDRAIDALVNLFSHHENHKYPNSLQELLPHVLQLGTLQQKAIEERDTDVCSGLTRLILSAADNNIKLLLALSLKDDEHRQLALGIVEMVLRCTAIPGHYPVDEQSSDFAFGFWYNLQDDILASGAEQQFLYSLYTPIYMSLVDILLTKVQYPEDSEYNGWNAEEKEQHRCYRQDIADTLMYSYQLLQNPLLGNFCQLMGNLIAKSATEQIRWQELEALLFAISSVAECVDMEETLYLPSIFTMLGQFPCTHFRVISQALNLIGAYAEWISVHPEILGSVIPLMLQGLKSAELAQSATIALKEVVRENQSHLMPYVHQILTAGKEALDSNAMKSRDTIRLMACIGYVLSVLPVAQIMEYLNAVLAPHVAEMEKLALEEPSAKSKGGILLKLSMLSWLFGSLNTNIDYEEEGQGDAQSSQLAGPQPVLLVLQQVMEPIKNVLNKWVSDPGVVEYVCDMLKRALKTLMGDLAPLVNDVIQLIVLMYQAVPHTIILDISKQLMVMFSKEQAHQQATVFLFQSLCTKSLSFYESGEIRNHPDVVEAFMGYLAQMAKKCPQIFPLSGVNLEALFQAGIFGLGMNEGGAVKMSCLFLSEFTNLSVTVPAAKEVVHKHGQTVVERLMRAIGGESPRVVIDFMSDVFMAFNKHCFELHCQWLKAMVSQDGFPNARATQQDKEQFTKRVLRERVHKRRLKETVTEFTLLWRGLIGTDYGMQSVTLVQEAGGVMH